MSQEINQDISFESIMDELNKTLQKLENGDLSLEESMKAYEAGVGLVRAAEIKITSMEGRMEEIMKDGEIKDMDKTKFSGLHDAA